jgi:hypothetical protein
MDKPNPTRDFLSRSTQGVFLGRFLAAHLLARVHRAWSSQAGRPRTRQTARQMLPVTPS